MSSAGLFSYSGAQRFLTDPKIFHQIVDDANDASTLRHPSNTRQWEVEVRPIYPRSEVHPERESVLAKIFQNISNAVRRLFKRTPPLNTERNITIETTEQYNTLSCFSKSVNRYHPSAHSDFSQQMIQNGVLNKGLAVTPELQKQFYPVTIDQTTGLVEMRERGICKGMVQWLIFTYLKTKDFCTDPQKHMQTLAKQFENGGNEQAVLLQNLLSTEMIGLKQNDWKTCEAADPNEGTRLFNELPIGAHRIILTTENGNRGHGLALIKVSNTLSYLFDPNFGVTEITGELQGGAIRRALVKDSMSRIRYNIFDTRIWISQSTLVS